uniref:Uncharacterized protein n=1 Tax=Schlesneria paludicola TaxID=360056 RepID=A0A7C2JZ73_9PLAN
MWKACAWTAMLASAVTFATPSTADARVRVYVGPQGGVAVRARRPWYGYGYRYPYYGYRYQ